MSAFQINSVGYHGGPEFSNIGDAKAYLKRLAEEDLKRARAKFGQATLVWEESKKGFTVKIGGPDGFNIWSRSWIGG